MTIQEQNKVKEKYYNEAVRYMDNAKECLKKAGKEGKFYLDPKYVRMACGTAYNGVLIALDGFLLLKGIDKPKGKDRKSIEYYHNNLGKLDKKILNNLNGAYQILHLYGYYDGINDVRVVNAGLDNAKVIINKIKPNPDAK
jgi:uncharacterized protein (UPF0332 family)